MIFCKNPDADVPILELYDFIGVEKDEFGVPSGISGQEFADYIKFIEGQGKKGIDIYINSVGGSIIEGMTIIAAIKSCTIPVNTVCVGVAVSMAGVILQAGKMRKMVKEGLMMIHPPSGGDAKELTALKGALLQFLYPRTNLTEDEMEALMDETSWLDAKTCLEMKLIDEIVDISTVANAPEVRKIENRAKRLLKITNELTTKTEPVNNTPMEINKLKNQLGLNVDATEKQVADALKDVQTENSKTKRAITSALKTVRNLLNKKSDEDDDEDTVAALKAEMEDMKKNYKSMEDKVKNLTTDLANKTKDYENAQAEIENLKNAGNKVEAEDAVNAAIEAGKIKAEVKDTFIDMYLADKDKTVALLDGIVVNKAGAKMNIASSKIPAAKQKVDGKNVSSEVADGKDNFISAFRKKITNETDKKLKGSK